MPPSKKEFATVLSELNRYCAKPAIDLPGHCSPQEFLLRLQGALARMASHRRLAELLRAMGKLSSSLRLDGD